MLRTSFSKYLASFVIIILVSFIVLSSMITYMVYNYAFSETEKNLNRECFIIVREIEKDGLSSIEEEAYGISEAVEILLRLNSEYNVMITDEEGKIILSTAHTGGDDSTIPAINTEEGLSTGRINISNFTKKTDEAGDESYVYKGKLNNGVKGEYMIYAKAIENEGKVEGYVMALASTDNESDLVRTTRTAVINNSIWVMVAAVIVAYFITDRIVKPLKKMTAAAKKFAKGDFSVRVSVSKNNDEVADLARSFNNMADSLESLEKMRNSFLANISHELRTPMTTIAGFIDGINSGAIPPEKHDYYLGIISAEVHRLSRLVTQLLDISRLESGERKFNYVDFDVAETARIILISFEQQIEDKRLDVEFDSEFDGMYVRADKDAIYQVIYNLCHNAIKFSKHEGKFKISLSRITDSKIKISVYNEGQNISEEDSKMIFDRFYKTDKSRGLDKSGVGLGLYICKTIVDAHNETIGVETLDDGCEFWFTLTEGVQPQKRKISSEK